MFSTKFSKIRKGFSTVSENSKSESPTNAEKALFLKEALRSVKT